MVSGVESKNKFNKHLIAIMDSDQGHWRDLGKALPNYYEQIILQNANTEAFDTIHLHQPALIVVGPVVRPKNAIDAIQKIQQKEPHIPIIFIANKTDDDMAKEAGALGVEDVMTWPCAMPALITKISDIINSNIEKKWDLLPEAPKAALQNSSKIFASISEVLITGETIKFEDVKSNCGPLVEVVESGDFAEILDGVKMHDDYTYAHSMRVATLLTMLGHGAGFSKNDQLLMSSGGLLHDVGKMEIPHNILNKPGKLTEEEFEIMKSHVTKTMAFLEGSDKIPKGVKIIAEQHHEKLDGTGYPHGLKGKELNELARMAAVVDVFSALTDRRPYKESMTSIKAIKIMEDEMCTDHLDSHYVKLFKTVLADEGVLK